MSVEKIITEYLDKNNYRGLLNKDGECGCDIKDLAPCENMNMDCEPGYLLECSICEIMESCYLHKNGADWCISSEKSKEKPK